MKSFLKALKNITKVIFFNLIIIIIGLLILEVVVRRFFPQPSYSYPQYSFRNDPQIGYTLTPNFSGRHCQPDYCVSIKFNSLGLRDDEFDSEERYDYKILALGDSEAFGNGVEFQDSALKILEVKLNENFTGKKIRIIKAGVPGYRTIDEYLYYENAGFKFNPDLVITLFSQNDVDGNFTRFCFKVMGGYLVDPAYERLNKVKIFLSTHSQLYCFLRAKINQNSKTRNILNLLNQIVYKPEFDPKQSDSERLEEAFKITEGYILKLDRAIKDHGSRHILILNPRSPERIWQRVNERIAEFCRQNNIEVFDANVEFSDYVLTQKKALYFRNDPHLNIEGNKVFAEILYKYLKDKIETN